MMHTSMQFSGMSVSYNWESVRLSEALADSAALRAEASESAKCIGRLDLSVSET